MSEPESVTYAVADHVATITLNRPEQRNALSRDAYARLEAAFRRAVTDSAARCVIVTGADPAFCSGDDVREIMAGPEGIRVRADAPVVRHGPTPAAIAALECDKPVIAAVNGAAIGGGLCLALACDLRLAAPGAYFRAAGINNGLTASELGLSFLLPRAVGSTRAADIMLTGRDVGAEEAERIGLVSSVHDDVVAAAVATGQRIAGFSQPGVELTKKSLHAGASATSLETYLSSEGIGQLYLRLLTGNFEEATLARKEGRAPRFTDER